MLDEKDWREIAPLMVRAGEPQAKELALEMYFEITSFRETNINAIWHHKTNMYGPPCRECGKPLRTDRAKWCPACGTDVIGAD